MASKKRTKKKTKPSKRKRSLAAKKGWETRRARKRAERAIKAHPQLEGIEEQLYESYLAGVEAGKKVNLKKVVNQMVKEGKVEKSTEEKIMARLILANDLGRFDEETFEITEDYPDEYSRSELYEMFFSPK